MPEVWMIGSVYAHPDYRGRGYGIIVTSAITKDAINNGTKARLTLERIIKLQLKFTSI